MNILTITREADSDLSTKQHQLVKATASNGCDAAAAGQRVLGVLTNDPTADKAAAVQVYGVAKVKAGAAVAVGDLLRSDANGKAVKADGLEESFGQALEAAGALDEIIDVLLFGAPASSATSRTGFIPLDLASAREIVSDDIPTRALTEGTPNTGNFGGLLATDTTPAYERINAATDKGLRVLWAAANVDAIQFAPIPLPPDLDDAADITVHLFAEMGGATDAPTVTVAAFFNVGDANAGGATGALADAVGEVTRTILAADVPAAPGVLNIELTPGAHATDTVALYAAWLEYTRK